MTQAHFDRLNLPRDVVAPCRAEPCPVVRDDLRAQPQRVGRLSIDEQHQRDLEVIARCEEQIEREAGCPDFFGCMGDLAARRRHG